MTRAPSALPSWMPAVPSPLAAEWTTSVSPALQPTPPEQGQVGGLEGEQEGGGLGVVELGGASNTETAGAMAYSAMPPRAVLVMATTRRPSHASAPSPAASTTPHTSMPSVKGGGVGTDTSLPRHRSMSLKLSEAAPTLTRTSPASGSGRSMVRTASTSPGRPCLVTCTARIVVMALPLVPLALSGAHARSGRRSSEPTRPHAD